MQHPKEGGKVNAIIVMLLGLNFFFFQTIIKTDDMDLAGDIIQSMTSFVGIEVSINMDCHMIVT